MARSTELRALALIRDYVERGEQIPNQQQFARELGISAKSRVSQVLANLERERFIDSVKTSTGKMKTHTISLNKMQRMRPVPVLGRIAAGQPLLANADDIIEWIPLPSQNIPKTEVYMLEVRGDSMIGDGILDGDYVIVDHNEKKPRDDEIAVVLIGEEATIKHIRYEGKSIRLISSNPEVTDQRYEESDRPIIQGKVIGVVRWLK
jgi:repressor LexA